MTPPTFYVVRDVCRRLGMSLATFYRQEPELRRAGVLVELTRVGRTRRFQPGPVEDDLRGKYITVRLSAGQADVVVRQLEIRAMDMMPGLPETALLRELIDALKAAQRARA